MGSRDRATPVARRIHDDQIHHADPVTRAHGDASYTIPDVVLDHAGDRLPRRILLCLTLWHHWYRRRVGCPLPVERDTTLVAHIQTDCAGIRIFCFATSSHGKRADHGSVCRGRALCVAARVPEVAQAWDRGRGRGGYVCRRGV